MIEWPHKMFRARSEGWSIQGSVVEGGRPMIGSTPQRSVYGGGGLVVAKINGIRLRTRAEVGAWRSIDAQLDNGANPIVVPCCDRRASPLVPGRELDAPHSDGAPFSDGSLYAGGGVAGTVKAAAAFRATTMSIRVLGGRPLIGGEAFSIRHPSVGWRIYRVAAVLEQTAVAGGFDYVITFRTPLRDAVAAGDEMEWRLPRCVMRLADPNGMAADLELKRFIDASVAFVEDFSAYEAWS